MATTIKFYPNLIDGTWKTLSVTPSEDRNPANHNEIIGLFPMDFYTRTRTIYVNHG